MARSCTLFLTLALIAVAYGRTNICLSAGAVVYQPLQLYPKDCPLNPSNCMTEVYNYSAPQYKSDGPKTLMPNAANKESFVYLTQDANNVFDAVIITTTTLANTNIKAYVNVTGANPGAATLVRDDPSGDTWNWNSTTNSGNITWVLQPGYTDGVVLGHFQFNYDYCLRVSFVPNMNGVIANIVFLSGNVTSPKRVLTSQLQNTTQVFEFCEYPQIIISSVDQPCGGFGSATAMSLNGTQISYLWQLNGATVGTTSTVNNLNAGTYIVTITADGCSVTRNVTVNSFMIPITGSYSSTAQTKSNLGTITLTVSGGTAPLAITWTNAAGSVIATNVTTVSVAAGTYTATVTDGCTTQQFVASVSGPGACLPGTMEDPDSDGCLGCPAGTYSATNNAVACTVCPPGSWNNAANATSCNSCAANSVSGGATEQCTTCPINTISAAAAAVCTPCAPGTDRATGVSGCTACAPGLYRCDPNSLCQPCPTGSFTATGSSACTLCDPGTFQNTTGQTGCVECAPSSYAAAGAASCSSCTAGTMSPAGSTVALACM